MANRYYSAIAVDTALTSSITSTTNSMIVGGTTGYPPTTPFVLAVDYSAATEELVLVTAVAGTTLTITRGYNGTTAQAHATGAVVRHVIVAQDLTDAQTHYALGLTGGAHGVTGALATFLGTPSSANLASVITDETGSGQLVFSTGPSIASPVITGTLSAGGSTGSAGQVLTSSGSGISWSSGTTLSINAQTSSYTLQASDVNALVTVSSSSATAVTVPPSVFSVGQQINVQALGTGTVSFTAGSGVIINGTGTALRAQYSGATLVCTASNTFSLFGDIQ
jgi:hypothetical protein